MAAVNRAPFMMGDSVIIYRGKERRRLERARVDDGDEEKK